MLTDDALQEQLTASQIVEYKKILLELCQVFDYAFSGIKYYQEKCALDAYRQPNQAATLYFDHLTTKDAAQVLLSLEKFIPDSLQSPRPRANSPTPFQVSASSTSSAMTSPRAIASPLSMLGESLADSSDHRLEKLKEHATTFAGCAVNQQLSPETLGHKIVTDFSTQLVTDGVLSSPDFDPDRMRVVLTALVSYYQEIEKLKVQRLRLTPANDWPLFKISIRRQTDKSILQRLHDWIDNVERALLLMEPTLLTNMIWCIENLRLPDATELHELLAEDHTVEEMQTILLERDAIYDDIEKHLERFAKKLQVPAQQTQEIQHFIDIVYSLQHPRPQDALTTIASLLKQLLTALQSETVLLRLKTAGCAQKYLTIKTIGNYQKHISMSFDKLKLAFCSIPCAHFVTETRQLIEKMFQQFTVMVDLQPSQINTMLRKLDKMVSKLEKHIREIDTVLVYELCPLRRHSDFDLGSRSTHYTYATNNRTALGTMAGTITEKADKTLAAQLYSDSDFMGSTITREDVFAVGRINDKLNEYILGEPPQALGGKDLIEQLLASLNNKLSLPSRHLEKIWKTLNHVNPFCDVGPEQLNSQLQTLAEMQNEFINDLPSFQALCHKLRMINNMLGERVFACQLESYQGNAQFCITDYCQWVVTQLVADKTLSSTTRSQLPILQSAFINNIIADINMVAGIATTMNYGDDIKRSVTAIAVDSTVAAGQAFYKSPTFKAIQKGQSDDMINMKLRMMAKNLYTVITKCGLWCEFAKAVDKSSRQSHAFPFSASAMTKTPLIAAYFQQLPSAISSGAINAYKALQSSMQQGLKLASPNRPTVGTAANGFNAHQTTADTSTGVAEVWARPATTVAKPQFIKNGDDNNASDEEADDLEAISSSESSSSSSSESREPVEQDRVISPEALLTTLLAIRDKLYTLMPQTMSKSCPKYGQSRHHGLAKLNKN